MKSPVRTFLFAALLTPTAWAASPLPVVNAYKRPTCGCCSNWVDHMKTSGFEVITHETDNVAEHKARLGVPAAMGSCHTAEVGGYLVEGHVPATEVKRLLAERPRARGILVPGMPASAPGMDDPRKIAYEVLLLKNDGTTVTYARQ